MPTSALIVATATPSPTAAPPGREHRALDEQLPNDSCLARAERRANAQLLGTFARAHEQQVRDVRAAEEQCEHDDTEHQLHEAHERLTVADRGGSRDRHHRNRILRGRRLRGERTGLARDATLNS